MEPAIGEQVRRQHVTKCVDFSQCMYTVSYQLLLSLRAGCYLEGDDTSNTVSARNRQEAGPLVVFAPYIAPCVCQHRKQPIVVTYFRVEEPTGPLHTHVSGHVCLPSVAGPSTMKRSVSRAHQIGSICISILTFIS